MEFQKRNTKIFLLSGKAHSGKNEVASIIGKYYSNHKSIKISFGHYLKEYAKRISDWDGSEENKPRELLQELGIKLIKNEIDDKLLIRRIIEDIKVYSYFYDIIIIEDGRLVDEIESIKSAFSNTTTIRINRSSNNNNLTTRQKNHITETNLDNYHSFDYEIENNGNTKDLEEKINKILGGINI